MPTEADTQAAESKVEKWLGDFETIVKEAKPSVVARNQRIKRAAIKHDQEKTEVWEEGLEDLEKAEWEYEEEVMDAQMDFENTLKSQGIVAEWEKLVGEVATEMDKCNMDMKKIKLSVKSLKSKTDSATNLSWSAKFHEKAPKPAEVNNAEGIIKGWLARGEGIMNDAKPAVEARDQRIVRAWKKAEQEEQEINEDLMEDLVEAQEDYEKEVMRAEHNFEEELTQNGVVADWEAFEKKVEADLNAMKKLSTKTIEL